MHRQLFLYTLEGYFQAPQVYNKYASAIIFNDTCIYRIKLGNVISQNNDEVFFLEKKYSFLHTPDTLYYPKSSIRAIVDSNYFCTYGKLSEDECAPITLKLFIEKIDSISDRPVYFELTANNQFRYCIDPGKWRITKIVREITEDVFIESFPNYNLIFEVRPKRTNYIGDIDLVTKEGADEKTIIIPFYRQTKKENFGALFGLIGAVIVEMSNNSSQNDIHGYYYFNINDANCPIILKNEF
jgi:hypothetical protein